MWAPQSERVELIQKRQYRVGCHRLSVLILICMKSAVTNMEEHDSSLAESSITLPNGTKIPNRLVKAAMEEGIGTGGGLPGKQHQRLYARWAEGGWGAIITGRHYHADLQGPLFSQILTS